MPARALAAVALVVLLSVAAQTQPPAAGQQPPKDQPKDQEPPSQSPSATSKPKWPSEIAGKSLKMWLKDVTDRDPAVREFALKTLASFGPDAKKECSKTLVRRMAFPSEGGEPDPGVRITLFNVAATIGLDEERDIGEAIRILTRTADTAVPGGLGRLHAVKTLGLIGPKASGAIVVLTGPPCRDPSYETRRSVAATLGQIGFNESTGPNLKALHTLSGVLAKDESAAVRMEALQSLVLLGPPWAEKMQSGSKVPPPIDAKGAGVVAANMKARLGGNKVKDAEPDKQLEIWCRLVMMRFDPKEVTPANLAALAVHLESPELGPKLQALQAIGLLGEGAALKIDAVVKTLEDPDLFVVGTAVNALGAMADGAKPAMPELEKLEKKLMKMRDDLVDKEDFKKLVANLKPEEVKQVISSLQEEQLRKSVVETMKFIQSSRPGMPGGPAAGGPKTP